jgi:hypothetical protein
MVMSKLHFVRHNQGRNWRALNFNRECWLMLLGFPLDHCNHSSIQNAIASFGRVILWENDRGFLARLLVKARVTDLEDVPHFIVISESFGFHGQSWTVQCEILEQQFLGGLPAHEDPIPVMDEDGHPPAFDNRLSILSIIMQILVLAFRSKTNGILTDGPLDSFPLPLLQE